MINKNNPVTVLVLVIAAQYHCTELVALTVVSQR